MLKAIETKYNGFIFRSRMEARWAVFMDSLRVKYEYEPEAYELEKGVVYLPDFWVPSLETFLEIKPEKPKPHEEHKAMLLAKQSMRRVIILTGNPVLPTNEVHGGYIYFPSGSADEYYWWCECPKCGSLGIEWGGSSHKLECGHLANGYQNFDSSRLVSAYDKSARQRFWSLPEIR